MGERDRGRGRLWVRRNWIEFGVPETHQYCCLSLSLSRCCPLCNICICLVLCAPFTVMRQGYHVYAARIEGDVGIGGGGVQPAYRCLPFNFYCFWRPAPRQAATNSYAIFVFIFHMQPHTQPPGPGPDLVTAPGLHTRTRAETHKHTHTCRENESQVSWLFTLRFLRYS